MFSTQDQYKIFKIKKKSGGFRQIEAPNDELKSKQRRLLESMKGQHYISPFCHSFRSSKNVVTNAKGHLGANYVLHIDASNFFPSITWNNFWQMVGYRGKRNKEFPKMDELKLAFCQFGDDPEPRLPQGAPTSPWLSNLYLSKFDTMMARYLSYLSVKIINQKPDDVSEYNYSRYADDITISGPSKERLWAIFFMMEKKLQKQYKITLNRKKTRMMGPGQRKIVCGIVVNVHTQPKRRWRKNLRAEIHNQLVAGKPLSKSTLGKIAYLNMCKNTHGNGSSKELYMSRMSKDMESI